MSTPSTTSDAVEVARAYFEAQDRHDTAALIALFGQQGTFQDPTMASPISSDALVRAFVGGFAAFPDMSFEVSELFDDGAGRVAAVWRMRGTNTGPLGNQAPTGQAIDVPGMDFIVVEGGAVRSARAYFDPSAMAKQLSGETEA